MALQPKKPASVQPSSTPSSTSGTGVFGEGTVSQYYNQLLDLKNQVQSGNLSLTDYQGQAEPLIKKAASLTYQIASSGSKGASAVVPIWNQFVQNGFSNNNTINPTVTMPFTRQEYAKLPDNVLPSQDDINQGLFDPTTAPLQRIRTSPQPAINPGPTGQPIPPGQTVGPTPTNQTGDAPIFTANPNNPPPYGGLQSNNQPANIDAQKIAQEAALQQQLSTQAEQARASQRKQYLSDLSDVLMKAQNQQFSEDNPAILEDLNSRGLLRSSELGNALAREQKSLSATTANNLAQYGIEGQTADLNDLKGIQDTYNQARNSALQRQFSVEDYAKQVQTGKEMGADYAKLTPNQGKAGSPTTGAAIQGAATLGAAAMTK